MGPELFIDFVKYEALHYINHKTIVDATVRFGTKNDIIIADEYEDWLYYFAAYKNSLIEIAKIKGSTRGDDYIEKQDDHLTQEQKD